MVEENTSRGKGNSVSNKTGREAGAQGHAPQEPRSHNTCQDSPSRSCWSPTRCLHSGLGATRLCSHLWPLKGEAGGRRSPGSRSPPAPRGFASLGWTSYLVQKEKAADKMFLLEETQALRKEGQCCQVSER